MSDIANIPTSSGLTDQIDSPSHITRSTNILPRCQLMGLDHSVLKQDLAVLRPGHSFVVKLPKTEDEIKAALDGGSFNLHYHITFDDGVQWMLRVRKDLSRVQRTKPGVTYVEYCWDDIEREVTALQVMFANGIMTVSNAYMPSSKEAIIPEYPTGHFYCDFMPGCLWPRFDAPLQNGLIDDGGARKYMEGYADHQIALSKIPFDKIGQLSRAPDGKIIVVPMYNVGYSDHHTSGPFATYLDYVVDLWYQSIGGHRGEVRGLQRYLVYLDRKRIVEGCKDFGGPPGEFYIKHADDRAGQNFAHHGELSAILDWQGASTTSKSEAFMSAGWLSSPGAQGNEAAHDKDLDSINRDEELLCAIYEEKGRPDLADCIRQTPKMRVLLESINGCRFVESIRRFRRIVGEGQDDVSMPETLEEWTAECMERFKHDPKIVEIQNMPKPRPWQPPMPPGFVAGRE